MSWRKQAAYYALLTALVVAAVELLSAAFLYLQHRDRIGAAAGRAIGSPTLEVLRQAWAVLFPEPSYTRMVRIPDGFFVDDAEQGYRANPGRYVFRYIRQRDGKSGHIDTVVSISRDGTRFTGNAPASPQRQIYVMGDSFVFGDGVNDRQTFAFLLQTAFSRDAVHLHALGGYSWANALVTLRRLEDRIAADDVIVLGYAAYYKERHVAAPARLRSIRDWMATSFPNVEPSANDRLLRARLDGADRLVLDTIPMHCRFNADYCASPEPSAEHVDKVSIALLRAIARTTKAKVYLLHMFGPKDDPVLANLPATVELIAATPADFSYAMRDDVMGFDDHGGPYWHYAMFMRLKQVLAVD
ncbi:MAG: hypothetical protein AB7F22_27065 [Reyranella sp.]|uniref:hypothetical protein n=1 Tax=Reyranella sp. TaxID=1929291 RepID=UPI003D0AB2CC